MIIRQLTCFTVQRMAFVSPKRKTQNMEHLFGIKLLLGKLMNKCVSTEMIRVLLKAQKLPDIVLLRGG